MYFTFDGKRYTQIKGDLIVSSHSFFLSLSSRKHPKHLGLFMEENACRLHLYNPPYG